MQDNILNFSNEEMQVLVDKKFFELKHSSTAKMIELFGTLEVELKSVFSEAALNVEGLNSSSEMNLHLRSIFKEMPGNISNQN